VDTQSQSGRRGEDEIVEHTGTRNPTPGHPARSQSLSRLLCLSCRIINLHMHLKKLNASAENHGTNELTIRYAIKCNKIPGTCNFSNGTSLKRNPYLFANGFIKKGIAPGTRRRLSGS
jgi:hypothetical protein